MQAFTLFFKQVKIQSIEIPHSKYSEKSKVIKSLRVQFFEGLANIIFIFLSKIIRYRKNVIHKNFKNSFPEISEQKEAELVNSYYRHLSDLIVEPFLINNLKEKDINNIVEYENIHLLTKLHRSGKDVLLLASHYGNWEYLLTLPLVTDYEVLAVYSQISNSIINRYMESLRSRFGVRLVKKSDWYRTVLNETRERPKMYVMIADQRPIFPFKNSVHFLEQKTYVQSGCERISEKLNCAVVYADTQKVARHKYRFKFLLMGENNVKKQPGGVLEEYYHLLEKTIVRNPSDWLWSHDRWKNHKH